jgi:hypothetical protein
MVDLQGYETVTSRRRAAAGMVLLGYTALGGTTAQEHPYVEKVEVNVRTVLVRITDRNGRAPSPPPGPEDIQVVEDGVPVQVLGVDPARPSPPPAAPAPQAAPSAPALEAPAAAPGPGIPQHLYVDTTMLQEHSVGRLAKVFGRSLDSVLSNGPLEIVVADPQPRQFLASTRDVTAIRNALQKLGSDVSGKQNLILLRQSTINTMRTGFCSNLEMQTRTAAEQEIRIIQNSLARLVRWAASLGGQRPDVVYLVSDGFDTNVVDTYTKVIQQVTTGARSCPGGGKPGGRLFSELQSEYAAKGGEMTGQAARSLAALGVQAVPIALGSNLRNFGNDASVSGNLFFRSISGPVPTFAGPIDPLRILAEATGGEVVTADRHLPAVLDNFSSSFFVSFRSGHSADGKVHDLRVTSRRPGLSVRSQQFITEGVPDSFAKGATVRALHEPAPEGGLPVHLAIDGVERHEKDSTGILHVDTDLESLAATLDTLNGGRMRVTIAVEVDDAVEPFTTNQEFDVSTVAAGWGTDFPLRWPAKGRRVAVTVEELKTGTRGTATMDLPQ